MVVNRGKELDLSCSACAKEVADLFGGEEYFSKTYPQLYSLFQNATKSGKNTKSTNQGYQNSAYIVDVIYDKQNRCAYAVGRTYLTETAKRLYCCLTILKNGEEIGRSSEFYSHANHAKIECKSVAFDEPANSVKYKGILYVAWQPFSQNQLHVMKASQMNVSIEGSGKDFVDTLTVNDPAYKKSTSGPIRVALWRRDSTVDYDYPDDKRDEDGNYEMHLKISGNAVLQAGHSVSRFSSFSAILNQVGSGSIFYDHEPSQSEIIISPDTKTLTWNLSDNWENFVPESTVAGMRDYSFDMKIEFFCNHCQMYHQLIISSYEYPQYEDYKFYKKIPMINILWGCLAKGTWIKMADGSLKKIEEVQNGDFILTSDGNSSSVKNVVVGTEDTMYQLCLEDNKTVLATITHPFLSNHGIVNVMNLTSRTHLQTEEGTFAAVVSCYPVEYGKKVYSLETDNGLAFFANGIASGTYSDQGKFSQNNETPISDSQVIEEIVQLQKDAAEGKIFGDIRQ